VIDRFLEKLPRASRTQAGFVFGLLPVLALLGFLGYHYFTSRPAVVVNLDQASSQPAAPQPSRDAGSPPKDHETAPPKPEPVAQADSAPSEPTVVISTPADGEYATFDVGTGQGGRVHLEGTSRGLSEHEVILLTVIAVDQIERPQWGGPATRPASDGHWQATVQVGNSDSLPEGGQKFTVKAYIVSRDEFQNYKTRSLDGALDWPPNERVRSRAECAFILTNRVPNR
jgi:hypothetical protein